MMMRAGAAGSGSGHGGAMAGGSELSAPVARRLRREKRHGVRGKQREAHSTSNRIDGELGDTLVTANRQRRRSVPEVEDELQGGVTGHPAMCN